MFRKRSHYSGSSAFQPSEYIDYVQENGYYIKKVSFETPKLPPVENFDLKALIDAGLPLERVSTIIRQGSFDASLLDPKISVDTEPKTKINV